MLWKWRQHLPKQLDVYLVVDVYSHALMGVYPSEAEAWLAADNTAAYCVIYKSKVTPLERPTS